MINGLVIRDVQKVDELCPIWDEEEKAYRQDSIRSKRNDGSVQDPHEKERRDEKEAELRDEKVEAVVWFALQCVHCNVHRFVRFFAH